MNTIEIIIKSSDGYDMDWKLDLEEHEQDHLAELILNEVDRLRGRVRES